MLEMLLVPLMALGLLAVPIGGDDAPETMDDTDDAGETPTETPVEPGPSPADFVTLEVGGETFTGADAGVSASDEPGVFDVTGTDGDDAVVVGETDARFDVAPGDGADTVTIGLNANVDMGDAVFGPATEITPPEGDGVPDVVSEQVDTADTDSDEIILNVTEAGIASLPEGQMFGSRIDLSDPDDALMIELPEGVEGNLHLIEVEEDTESETGSTNARYTLVVLTDPDVAALTDDQAQAIVAEEAIDLAITRLAFVDQGSVVSTQGTDRLDLQSDQNTEPMIAANRDIASQSSVVL